MYVTDGSSNPIGHLRLTTYIEIYHRVRARRWRQHGVGNRAAPSLLSVMSQLNRVQTPIIYFRAAIFKFTKENTTIIRTNKINYEAFWVAL